MSASHESDGGKARPGFPGGVVPMLAEMAWQLAVTGGAAATVLGVIVLVWPGETLVVAAALFSVYLLVSGTFQLAAAFGNHVPAHLRTAAFLSGALSVLLGLVCLRGPAQSILFLGFWIGFGWLLRGITQTMAAASADQMPGRGWLLFSGLVTILAGVVTVVAPLSSIAALTVLAGIWLVVVGVTELGHGIRLRREVR